MSQLTLDNSHKFTRPIIAFWESLKNGRGYYFPRNWNYLGQSLTLVYYTCFSKPAMHVDDCFKFKWHIILNITILESYNQQNFALNAIWMIISNATSFEA